MKTVTAGALKPFTLLPPAPDKCQECATDHEPEQPHNAQSLFYQMKFQLEHGHGASWIDAMAHCTEKVRAVWTEALEAAGVNVEAGEVNPR